MQDAISHDLNAHFGSLRRYRSYEELVASPFYLKIGDSLESILNSAELVNFDSSPFVNPKPFFRAVAWNIERGMRLDDAIAALKAHPVLQHGDFFLLSETDLGMVRSENRNVAREIAEALKCNYFFGTSYLNLDKGNGAELDVEGENTLGLHGNALLSRYPIVSAELIPLKNCKNKLKGKEKRLGSQKALLVRVEVEGGRQLAVVCVHLDAHSSQRQRVEQMETILNSVEAHCPGVPVLVGGDWNTSTYNASHGFFAFWGFWWRVFNGVKRIIRDHYPYPERRFEKKLFRMVEKRGFDYRRLNAMGEGTIHYDIEDIRANKNLSDWVPQWCIDIMNRTLAAAGGRASLKVDWFIGRGVSPVDLHDSRLYREGAPSPIAPSVIPCPKGALGPVSDHDAIVLDFMV